jgi:AraC family transcriptional regulator, positive regulator of tynA and feaB
MRTLFSSAGVHPRNSFQLWQETFRDRIIPIELSHVGDQPFRGELEVADLGPLRATRLSHTALRSVATPEMVRRHGKADTLHLVVKLAGGSTIQQDDREAVFREGDLVMLDCRPTVHMAASGSHLVLELPRERIENVLGPAKLYTALPVAAESGSATLARTFFRELIRVRSQLAPEAAASMATVGIDLIVASLAERLAQEVPRSIHGNVVVQRAKIHVEVHLGDPSLDPLRLAGAMGVSLRRLQELFHARGQHVSDYIWNRRLDIAAKRLADPGCAHLPIGVLAYGCGFTSQAHFSRRFKDRFGATPGEYRQAALLPPI